MLCVLYIFMWYAKIRTYSVRFFNCTFILRHLTLQIFLKYKRNCYKEKKKSRLFFSTSVFDIVCKIIIRSRTAENKIFYFGLEISLAFASDVNVGKTNELPVRHISIDTR